MVTNATSKSVQPMRTSGHDQTKINILQLFHAKKEAIQYPRFIKLIIADLIKKFPNIPKRIREDYHSIKDDVPLVSVYTIGNVLVRGMLIPNAFLTAEIRETDDFKEYKTVFMKVAVPMNQPQQVVSTQGTNRNTPRAHRSPTVSANPLETKKRKQTAGESSLARRIIKKKKQPTPSIPPLRDDRERDAIAKATLLSLALHKTALIVEAQQNIAKVDNEIEKEKEVKRDKKEKENEEVRKEQNIVEKEVENETNVEAEKTDEVVKEKEIDGIGRRRGQIRSNIKNRFITQEFFTKKIQEVLKHCDTIVPELTVAKTNEMIKTKMPHLIKLAVDKD
ncbi:hypothetical protein Tco_0654740 [Tanacetum coccineum]|uniref:Uncharacterized protein n=1 Tax=Tanacetum coccineum TaxID=301880 RepID=A0ABQ4X525_9ASTR